MELSKCISDICEFPLIYSGKNKAPIAILKDSGYYQLHEKISTSDILEYVRQNPQLIQAWIQYSEDIRWSPAWALGPESGNLWKVSYYDRTSLVEERTFTDKFEACATMIKMTAEEIRKD